LRAARYTNQAAVGKFTVSQVTGVINCRQVDGNRFEKLTFAVNYVIVTVHLTDNFNKYAVFLFLF
jgi:hypothetical protein